ncbi:hypothetical protein OYB20_20040 [Escherichia coli]|nr:hypothetical protein [Escherichia coli]MCY6461752.1 hypothetical protein [Escherichia coli]
MKKDDLITRCKLLKGERDESIFTILIGIVVKLGLVGPDESPNDFYQNH